MTPMFPLPPDFGDRFIGSAWSCVEGRVRKSTACSSFGSGSVNNPSQGIPGPFSFKRLLLPTLRGRGIAF